MGCINVKSKKPKKKQNQKPTTSFYLITKSFELLLGYFSSFSCFTFFIKRFFFGLFNFKSTFPSLALALFLPEGCCPACLDALEHQWHFWVELSCCHPCPASPWGADLSRQHPPWGSCSLPALSLLLLVVVLSAAETFSFSNWCEIQQEERCLLEEAGVCDAKCCPGCAQGSVLVDHNLSQSKRD